jgi:hypothetical protein
MSPKQFRKTELVKRTPHNGNGVPQGSPSLPVLTIKTCFQQTKQLQEYVSSFDGDLKR